MGDVLPADQQLKFFEISKAMAKALRRDIMDDMGNSLLKSRCLDVITNLRLE